MAIDEDVVEGDAGEAEIVDDKDKARSQQSKAMNSMTDLVSTLAPVEEVPVPPTLLTYFRSQRRRWMKGK